MGESSREQKPKTKAAHAGGPPKPPKKTARGLNDDGPDDSKKFSATERAELAEFLKRSLKQ
jgi:hypothetical protein